MASGVYTKWKKLQVYSIIAVLIYVGMRWLIVPVLPFFVSFLLLKILYPLGKKVEKHCKIPSWIIVFTGMGILLSLTFLCIWFLGKGAYHQFAEAKSHWVQYEKYIDQTMDYCCDGAQKILGIQKNVLRESIQNWWIQTTTGLGKTLEEKWFQYVYEYVGGCVKIMAFFVVIFVITILTAKDYEKIKGAWRKNAFYTNIQGVQQRVFQAFFVYVRAQAILFLLVSVYCVVFFLILKVPRGIYLAPVVGVIDALPFLGSGLILIPWIVIQLFRGKVLYAVALGLLYGACVFTREFLEPKLIGKFMGVFSVYIVATVYIGIILYGGAGVLLGPIHALLTWELGKQWIQEHNLETTLID